MYISSSSSSSLVISVWFNVCKHYEFRTDCGCFRFAFVKIVVCPRNMIKFSFCLRLRKRSPLTHSHVDPHTCFTTDKQHTYINTYTCIFDASYSKFRFAKDLLNTDPIVLSVGLSTQPCNWKFKKIWKSETCLAFTKFPIRSVQRKPMNDSTFVSSFCP